MLRTFLQRGRKMPKEIESALRKRAMKMGMKGERADRYVYGTMRKRAKTSLKQKHKKRQPSSLKEAMMMRGEEW